MTENVSGAQSAAERENDGLAWVEKMSEYRDLLSQIENQAFDEMLAKMEKKYADSRLSYIVALCAVILAALICPPSLSW